MAKIYKLTGAGNNFLFIDFRDSRVRKQFEKQFGVLSKKSKRSHLARKLCDPFQSVGADGLLFLENSAKADIKWDFYNADGSSAEMCGNAARCVGRYVALYDRNLARSRFISLETAAGSVGIFIDGTKSDAITVEMPVVTDFEPNLSAALKSKATKASKNAKTRIIRFDFVNSGVPHAVVSLPAVSSVKDLIAKFDQLNSITSSVRALPRFKKSGTNVTFRAEAKRAAKSGRIFSLTFERGVAGYTQACGTGAVAAAVCFAARKRLRKIQVQVPGGELEVKLHGPRPHLTGKARLVAEVELC